MSGRMTSSKARRKVAASLARGPGEVRDMVHPTSFNPVCPLHRLPYPSLHPPPAVSPNSLRVTTSFPLHHGIGWNQVCLGSPPRSSVLRLPVAPVSHLSAPAPRSLSFLRARLVSRRACGWVPPGAILRVSRAERELQSSLGSLPYLIFLSTC